MVAGWLGVGVGGGASADPAIREGSAVEGEGRGRAFGVGMSDPGRKTRRGGGSSSRVECDAGRKEEDARGSGHHGATGEGRSIAGGGVVRLVDALRPPLRISREEWLG